MEKGIRNADVFAYKLRPASIKAINKRLKVSRKKKQKKEEEIEKEKTKAMTTKC